MTKEYAFTKGEEQALLRIKSAYQKKGLSDEGAAEAVRSVREQLKGLEPKHRKLPLATIESALK